MISSVLSVELSVCSLGFIAAGTMTSDGSHAISLSWNVDRQRLFSGKWRFAAGMLKQTAHGILPLWELTNKPAVQLSPPRSGMLSQYSISIIQTAPTFRSQTPCWSWDRTIPKPMMKYTLLQPINSSHILLRRWSLERDKYLDTPSDLPSSKTHGSTPLPASPSPKESELTEVSGSRVENPRLFWKFVSPSTKQKYH